MEEIFVKEDYSTKLKKELDNNYNQEMIIELKKYRGFLSYAFSVRLACEGYRVTTKYKTDLGDFKFRQHINKVECNKIIDNKNGIHIEAKEKLIRPIICKSSCGSYLKRYNPLLLAKVVKLYKKMKKYKECLDLLHDVFSNAIYDRIPLESINIQQGSYNHNDVWQIHIYRRLYTMLDTLE